MSISTILVPTDFSEASEEALTQAIAFAQTFKAKIHLVHSLHLPIAVPSFYQAALPPALISQLREAAREAFDARAARVSREGIEVETHLSDEDPSEVIRSTAASIGADLIVMGTHGHTGLKHVLLGSVAERVLRTAPCPVLTVRPS